MNHNQAPKQESAPEHEFVQFIDGRLALGYRTPGTVIEWDSTNRYSDPESQINTIVVRTKAGRRFALGRGVVIILPELDREKGEFGKLGQPVTGARIREFAPNGLPSITIGEPWADISPSDPVEKVMMDYKIASPGYNDSEQIPHPNFFDSARDQLTRFDEALAAQGK